MKYNISINQKAVIDNGFDLDIIDLAIFDFFKDFLPLCKKVNIPGEGEYSWVKDQYIINEMPVLGIKTVQGIKKRINNLIDAGLLLRSDSGKSIKMSLYMIGPNYHKMVREDNKRNDETINDRLQSDETAVSSDYKQPFHHIIELSNNNINNHSVEVGEKNSPPTQPIPPNPVIPLFSEFEEMAAAGLPEKKERSVLFHNSDIGLLVTPKEDGNFDYKEFEAKFEGPEFEKIDLVYYYHKVSDWSARKNRKATNAGWLAWVREFIRGDAENGKVKLKAEHQADHNKFDVDSYLRYMDKNSEY